MTNVIKSNILHEKHKKSVDGLFSGIPINTSRQVIDILTAQLSNPLNAKYKESLDILKYARNNKNIAGKKLSQHMSSTLENLTNRGLSDNTIDILLTSFFDNKLNYYNTEAKIQALGNISIHTDTHTWTNEIDYEKQINAGIGGTCADLSTYLYNSLVEQKLTNAIYKDTGTTAKLRVVTGHCDTYFTNPNEHTFLILQIGNSKFVIDPSLGVLSRFRGSGYYLDNEYGCTDDGEKREYSSARMQQKEVTKFYVNEDTNEINIWNRDTVPLGFLSGTKTYLDLYFAETSFGKTIPVISGAEENDNSFIYFMKDDKLIIAKRILGQYFIQDSIEHKLPKKKIQSILTPPYAI